MFKNKLIDVVLGISILLLGVFFFNIVSENRQLGEKLTGQQFAANSLIEEVGQAKADNQVLFQKLQETRDEMEKIKSFLNSASQNVSVNNMDVPVKVGADVNNSTKVPRVKIFPPVINSKVFLIVGSHQRLADTIMLAAVHEDTKEIVLVSIPRDLFVNGRKINEYLAKYGAEVLKEKVEEVTNVRITGYVVVNLKAFETIIDALDGIDVNVEKPIYDETYPGENGGYTIYSIDAGIHHLDGASALKYARSRHSTSDFDRAKRQQQIIDAVISSVANFDFLTNIDQIKKIYESLSDAVETDMDFIDSIRYLDQFRTYKVYGGNVLSTENFLHSTISLAGQYILLPKGGDFSKVQKYLKELLE